MAPVLANPTEKRQPLILNYRTLRTSLLFGILWFLIALLALLFLGRFGISASSAEGVTLIITSALCVVLAITSLEQYGSPFIYFYPNRLKIHYSLLRNVNVNFSEIAETKVVEEELVIIRRSGSPIYLNLAHLSFRNQGILIRSLQSVLNPAGEKTAAKPERDSKAPGS